MPSAMVAHSIGTFSDGRCVFTAWRMQILPARLAKSASSSDGDAQRGISREALVCRRSRRPRPEPRETRRAHGIAGSEPVALEVRAGRRRADAEGGVVAEPDRGEHAPLPRRLRVARRAVDGEGMKDETVAGFEV